MCSRWCRNSILAAGFLLALGSPLPGQGSAADDLVGQAYAARQSHQLERAVELFRQALDAQPENVALRKDFAYTLLSIGKTEEARDQFGRVVSQTPKDSYAALEYAFLCHDTGRREEAWLLFKTLRESRNAEHRETAQRTFSAMEKELQATIARLEAVLAADATNYASHLELARAHAVRNEFGLAAASFEAAYRLKPQHPEVLLDLAAALRKSGNEAKAKAIVLSASRSPSAFVTEQAKDLLPGRYPFLSEFEAALAFDPNQPALRREMAYFLLSLKRETEAMAAFEEVLRQDPKDYTVLAQVGFLKLNAGNRDAAIPMLTAALRSTDGELKRRVSDALQQAGISAEEQRQQAAVIPQPELANSFAAAQAAHAMGEKSYAAGFMADAIRYFEQAHRLDPTNFQTILRLAWSLNVAQRDDEALRWFGLAAKSPEPSISEEARQAIRNLQTPSASPVAMAGGAEGGEGSGLVSSLWVMPLYSSRWASGFAYAQAKIEYTSNRLRLVPYFSLRFVGDSTGAVGSANPQFLSENAIIAGLGVRSRPWHGMLFWAEAGTTMAYLASQRHETGSVLPDYRGGLSQMKLCGPSLQNGRGGWFAETMNDLIYIHRFDRDTLAISRNRVGRHFGKSGKLGGFQFQAFLNLNLNTDFKREAWANFAEAGPGVRFRWASMPPPVSFTFSYLRGMHTIRRMDDRPNTYSDFQTGVWYAISR